MKNDFFTYSCRKIEKDKVAGRCDVANNRGAALKCLSKFLGKEELTFGELSPEMMTQFKEWLNANGRKESTARLYLYQIHTLYKEAEKEAIAPHLPLLSGIKLPLPFKQKCELLTEEELRRMRYADLSDSMSQTFARDMFFFSIYCRGISFTDLAHIRKSDIKGFTLTYTSQVLPPPTHRHSTIGHSHAAIADRYPSTTDYLFPIIKSDDKIVESREIGRVRENITKALKLIATRCNLSVVPSLKMTKDIYQRAIDGVSVSKII